MRFVALVLLLSANAVAATSPISLALDAHGSAITFKFTNQTKSELTIPTRITADVNNYDWLTVRLRRGATVRNLGFELSRDKSSLVNVKLAPGASTTETIDLAEWAILGDNGGPLDPGDYDVEATWDATKETTSFRQTATAKLHVPAPVEGTCKDSSHEGLEVLARQVGHDPVLEIGLHNVDKVAHCVQARVNAGEIMSPHLAVSLDATGRTTSRMIRFSDVCTRCIDMSDNLAPGATTWMRFDLQDWAKRRPNGGTAIAPGSYYLGITYDARTDKGVWNGMATTKLGINFK